MDFSYLNKDIYSNIPLLNETNMGPNMGKCGFYIRKYKPKDEIKNYHRHEYVQINYVNKGSGYHTINNKKIPISKGDIFIIPPYIPHTILSNENGSLEIFEFEFKTDFVVPIEINLEDAESYLDYAYLEPFMVIEENVNPRFNLNESLQKEVEKILYEVLDEYKNKYSGYILVARALLLKLLVIVGRAYAGAIKGTETEIVIGKFKKIIYSSLDYINENYEKNISLNDVANAANYSRSRFSFLFKAITGQTFIEYLNGVRIEKSKELLKNTDMNITDISFAVGYNTITNFNKNFKFYTGLTPKNYKNKLTTKPPSLP